MNDKTILTTIQQYGTPCFFVDEDRFQGNIIRFREALTQHFPNNIIGYSFKTNYAPAICAIAKGEDCYAEVVSRMELELAAKLEYEQGRVLFNGPIKSEDDLRLATGLGAIVNLDNLEQVQLVCKLANRERISARIGLRVNVDLTDKLLQQKLAKGGLLPRFGMRNQELAAAVDLLRSNQIEVVSLHGHSSSSDRAAENYTAIASELLAVRKAFQLVQVQYIDVGGGFLGTVPAEFQIDNAPAFSDYAKAIHTATQREDWFQSNLPTLIVEPGMALIADCVSYATNVVSVRNLAGQRLIGVDGNCFDVRPTGHDKMLPHRLVPNQSTAVIDPSPTTVVGSTCMEKDLLFESALLPPVKNGNTILISNVGAYCSVLSPPFINFAAPIVGMAESGGIRLIRKRQQFHDFFTTYIF